MKITRKGFIKNMNLMIYNQRLNNLDSHLLKIMIIKIKMINANKMKMLNWKTILKQLVNTIKIDNFREKALNNNYLKLESEYSDLSMQLEN